VTTAPPVLAERLIVLGRRLADLDVMIGRMEATERLGLPDVIAEVDACGKSKIMAGMRIRDAQVLAHGALSDLRMASRRLHTQHKILSDLLAKMETA
jgi:hypothetical protein